MLKVTLAIAFLLNQADARADEWTTTGKIISDSWYGSTISSYRKTNPGYFVWKGVQSKYDTHEPYDPSNYWTYSLSSEYETDEKKYGAINWMKICRKSGYRDSNLFKLEWTYANMCDESAFSTKYCVGDCQVQNQSPQICNEINLVAGECINNLSFYASQSSGIQTLAFETTDGTEGVLHDYSFKTISETLSQFSEDLTEWKVNMTNSTTISAKELVCLTALQPEIMSYSNDKKPSIINYKVSYNPDTPQYNGTECEQYRNKTGLIVGGILIGICFVGGIAWFFFTRRTRSAGSLTADNQKPSTPEVAPKQTTTTTTIIQEPTALMVQPQPMMMQEQPMMMQQTGMMPMQQPGMMPMQPMQQPGMMPMQPMQQPGMMPMQPMQQPGMMPMQPIQQPGMGYTYDPYAQ